MDSIEATRAPNRQQVRGFAARERESVCCLAWVMHAGMHTMRNATRYTTLTPAPFPPRLVSSSCVLDVWQACVTHMCPPHAHRVASHTHAFATSQNATRPVASCCTPHTCVHLHFPMALHLPMMCTLAHQLASVCAVGHQGAATTTKSNIGTSTAKFAMSDPGESLLENATAPAKPAVDTHYRYPTPYGGCLSGFPSV